MVKQEKKLKHIDECVHAKQNGHSTRSITKTKSPPNSKKSSSKQSPSSKTVTRLIHQQQELREAKLKIAREYLIKHIKDNNP